ncbi:E3 ubiquitin-protein ligase bre1 [Rhodotorula kratochvilovae]
MNGALPARPASAGTPPLPASAPADRKRGTALADNAPPPSKRARREEDVEQDEEDDDMPEEDRKLESFRKEAIYREMLSYKRQLHRALADASTLRSQRTAYEVRLARVELAWTALVNEADLILPSTSAAPEDRAASPPLTAASTLDDDALDALLAHRSGATKALLARLQALHPTPSSSSSTAEDLTAKCRALLAESTQSREALRVLRAEHDATLEQLEGAHAALVRAERKFDRFQSATVAALEGRAAPPARAASGGNTPLVAPKGEPSPAPNGGAAAGPASALDTGDPPPAGGGAAGEEVEELRALVSRRADELEEMRRERVALKLEIDTLKGKLVDIPEDLVAETPLFRAMQQHVQYLASEYATQKGDADRAAKEADELREGMEAFRETAVREASEQVTDLQTRLSAHESDLTRLRAARDELKAETSELRAKESDKARALDELKTLAQARKSRLLAYESELRRLRIGKAAERGDLEGVDLRVREAEAAAAAAEAEDDEMEEGEVDVGEDNVVADLKARLNKAEGLLLALRDQLSDYAAQGGGMPAPSAQQLIDSETRARADLAEAQQRVLRLEAIIGPGGRADVREMAERLEEKQRELKVAEAQVKSQEAASNMLYGEIDRLSAAWQSLDEQNASKVFNLAALEDKIQRLSADKAKADNRYFATMRQKDALGGETAVLQKLAEKQQQKIESQAEVQRALSQQLAHAEKEISMHQNNVRAWQEQNSDFKRKNTELQLRSDQTSQQVAELTARLNERINEAEDAARAKSAVEEQLAKADRQLQQAQAKAASAAASSSGTTDPAEVRELKKYNADLMRMLRCSTCNIRFKQVTLSRCGHTFCRECADARLANRQRKCPACAAPFSREDVLPIFL